MKEIHHCHSCGKEAEGCCQRCEQPVCDKCTVPYTQFNQIDYDLCNDCNHSYQDEYMEMKAEEDRYNKMKAEEEIFFRNIKPELLKQYHRIDTILKLIKNKLGK